MFGILQEKAIFLADSHAIFQFFDLFDESSFGINFVREHAKLESEELFGSRVLEFLWLIHLGPDVVDVFFQGLLEEIAVAS